jgi:hypothetical protein
MSQVERNRPTPHRYAVELASLEGVSVLGEPLRLLFSGLLRLRFGPSRDGMMDVEAVWPKEEADALQRAMVRAEPDVPGDLRTIEQRDCDRFLAVVERVLEVSQAVGDHGLRGTA